MTCLTPMSHLRSPAGPPFTDTDHDQEMEPMLALLHNRKVMTSVARFEMGLAKWSRLDRDLKELA